MQEFLILGKGMVTHPERAAVAAGRRLRVVGGGDLSGRRRSGRPRVRRAAHRSGDRVGRGRGDRQQLQIHVAAISPAGARHHADLSAFRRERAGPQQVLQDRRPGGQQPLPAGLGSEQEGSGAAGRAQRPARAERANGALPGPTDAQVTVRP